MPSLNFKKEFVDLITSGKKRQTIRPKRKNPIKVGDKLYLFTGQRTSKCRYLFGDNLEQIISNSEFVRFDTFKTPEHSFVFKPYVICISVQDIIIHYGDGIRLEKNGITMSFQEEEILAKKDGFECRDDFINFFKNHYGLPFKGVLIKW